MPQKKKRTKRKRRKKKRSNQSNNSDQTNKLDVSEMHNVWIDVEDVVKIINPSRSTKGKNLDGSDIIEFPPLKSETKDEEEKDLTAMDTSELKSYADVLSRALGGASSKNPSSNDDGSEMDISNGESSVDTPGPEIEHKPLPENVSEETTTTDGVGAAKSKADDDEAKREKEKRALKLAELKAKAKLANAKLRMALQRKEAMGNTPKPTNASVAVANSNGRTTPTYTASTHQTKRNWQPPASNVSALRDISALRNIRALTIPNVSVTGADEMVRFIDSVYDLSSEDEDSSESEEEEDKKEEEDKPIPEAAPDAEAALPNDNKNQKKSHQSLKQQLQLAKLRLEIKRKEQLLLEKKRKMPVVAMTTETPSKLPLNDMTITADDLPNAPEDVCNDNNEGKAKSINDVSDAMVSSEDKKAKLEQLRQRQKELKQKNEVSNLKNLINRQRQLLRSQGQELAESSTQLEGVVRDITTKQTQLDESNKRLEEMNHRKKIMEGMMLRATQKLMSARKALGEHKQKSVIT